MDVTIKDIARQARVSYATVSRALNNKHGVRERTRARIVGIAEKLGYRPNALARGLVKRQTHTLGLIIPDITNPFFPEVVRGIEEVAVREGFSIFLCNTNWDPQRESSYLNLLIEKRVAGIIVAPTSKLIPLIEQDTRRSLPVVYVSNAPGRTRHSSVVIDNLLGGFLATRHLIETGHGTIGFIGSAEDSHTLEERLAGYRKALREFGVRERRDFVQLGDFRQETGHHIIQRMIKARRCPRAVFAENDLLALGVLQGVQEMGLSVPGDVAVVGFDDIPFAAFPAVQLTTIAQPKYEMGQRAMEVLLGRIRDPGSGRPAERVLLEPRLIVRRSSVAG